MAAVTTVAVGEHTLVTAKGAAAGKIAGINHIQMVVRDMEPSVRFYRDLLGLRVVRTRGKIRVNGVLVQGDLPPVAKNYFFDLGNGELLTLIEVKEAVEPDTSVYGDTFWPGGRDRPQFPGKMDHLALNVADRDTVVWFRDRLIAHGVAVSRITERVPQPDAPSHFVCSIYFYDPSGNPLEIATFDWGDDSKWRDHKPESWFMDQDPSPALVDASDAEPEQQP